MLFQKCGIEIDIIFVKQEYEKSNVGSENENNMKPKFILRN